MNILMIVHPAIGPHNCTFCLAKLFRDAGDTVYYFIEKYNPAVQERIRAEGFQVLSSADILPQGAADLNRIIVTKNVGLVVLDADQLHTAITLYHVGIPKIFINTILASDRCNGIPPFTFPLIPRDSAFSRLAIRLIWFNCLFFKRLKRYWSEKITTSAKDIYHVKLAREFCFDLKKYADYNRSWLYRLSVYPEFFMHPAELEFPQKEYFDNQYVLGPLLDLDRKEASFDWSFLPNNNPIVYCSLGTLPHIYYSQYDRFLNKIIKVFGELKQFNLILAAGKLNYKLHTSFNNIFLFETVPQLQVLSRARLMIGHGGINSIKECLHFGVPMLIYPIGSGSDQNGNSARVMYHRLGLRGNVRKDSVQKIRSKVLEVYSDGTFAQNAHRFSLRMKQYKAEEKKTVSFLKEMIMSKRWQQC